MRHWPTYASVVDDGTKLSEASITWTAYRTASWPERDDDRLRERFGAVEAESLVRRVHRVHEECWASGAHLTAADLPEMGRIAAEYLRERYPQLSGEAVEAVVWAYTFDNK
jgi:hypothetical protein